MNFIIYFADPQCHSVQACDATMPPKEKMPGPKKLVNLSIAIICKGFYEGSPLASQAGNGPAEVSLIKDQLLYLSLLHCCNRVFRCTAYRVLPAGVLPV